MLSVLIERGVKLDVISLRRRLSILHFSALRRDERPMRILTSARPKVHAYLVSTDGETTLDVQRHD